MNEKNQKGSILAVVFVAVGLVLFTALSLISGAQIYYSNATYSANSEKATLLAEAGIDKALASLNKTGGSYNGEAETVLGDGSYSVSITNKNATTKVIESTGFFPSKVNPKVKRIIKVETSNGIGLAFNYAIQVGDGGLNIAKDSTIIGSVYSNGSISLADNARITGDAYVAGGTSATADQQIECVEANCTDFIFGKSVSGNNQLDVAMSFKPGVSQPINKVALKLKKFGSPPNLTVRIMGDNNGKPNKGQVLASGVLSASLVSSNYSFVEVAFVSPPNLTAETLYWIMLDTSSDSSNFWAWSNDLAQSYTGGFAKYSPNWNASNPVWNSITGDLAFKTYMGGMTTFIEGKSGALVSGDAHANTLKDLTIGKGAYYQVSQNITAANYYPGSTDPASQTMPISDANILDWKSQAQTAGEFSGTGSCQTNLAAGKYSGSITLPADCTITVGSPIWVTGNLTMGENSKLKLDPSSGSSSGVFVVDNFINLAKDDKVLGSGSPGSYLILISNFNSRDDPGHTAAINVSKEGNNAILYSNLGTISISKENDMTSVTGWKLDLAKEITITYDQGLAGTFFSSGPAGSYSLIKGTYQIK